MIMQHSRRSLLYNLLVVFSILLIVGLFNFIYDPCMEFRHHNGSHIYEYRLRHTYNKAVYGNFETAIIGSSTSLKSSKSIFNKFSKQKVCNLAVDGTNSYISHAMIKRAIDKQNIKRIIIGYDFFNYNHEEDKKDIKYYQPDSDIFYKAQYLLDLNLAISQFEKVTLNQINNAGNQPTHSLSAKERKKHLFTNCFVHYHTNPQYKRNIGNVDRLVKLISDNPKVHFDIYFTPYHILWWYKLSKLDALEKYFEIKKETINRILPLKNVSLYDFQNVNEIVFDIYSFRDSIHFHSNINEIIFKSIEEKRYQINGNMPSHLFESDMRSKIERFEKENAQSLIDYRIAQDIELIKKNAKSKR